LEKGHGFANHGTTIRAFDEMLLDRRASSRLKHPIGVLRQPLGTGAAVASF
jgi:hypothetical protein